MNDDENAVWVNGFRSAIPGQYTEWQSANASVDYSHGRSAYHSMVETIVGETMRRIETRTGNVSPRVEELERQVRALESEIKDLRQELNRKDAKWGSF